ncbi:hypothetical protein [Kitasatospora paracochleata]|uniref:hypothetical protein n=1 Tax=Kitasatospora paracochleata TaxID=58354 RepID=UPI0020A55AF0|nr:hypothetical protein [Kitasatospora paracochleata]
MGILWNGARTAWRTTSSSSTNGSWIVWFSQRRKVFGMSFSFGLGLAMNHGTSGPSA